MKVFIVTVGSRGDVQPFVALGKGLKAAGHAVTLCTSSRFESFITDYGLNYGYMNDELMKLMDSAAGRDAMENTSSLLGGIRTYVKLTKEAGRLQRLMLRDSWNSAQEARPDVILFHPKAYGGPHFAEKLGIPVILVLLTPLLVPTREFPSMGFPEWQLGGWYNKLTTTLVLKLTSVGVGKYVKEWRTAHGLPRQPRGIDFLHTTAGEPLPVLHAYSKHVLPHPADWPEIVVTTGYWFLSQPEAWRPPIGLLNFLDAGEPPVYVGFGSMAGRNPQLVTRTVVEALRQANVRGIISTGCGGLAASDLPGSVFSIHDAPHEWLFPRVAAVVHHGGAGTTAAALRAGRPTIICPFFGDQPFWGRRIHALGAGTDPIPQKNLTFQKLAAALREVLASETVRENAEGVAEKLRLEDGVANAMAIIEGVAKKR